MLFRSPSAGRPFLSLAERVGVGGGPAVCRCSWLAEPLLGLLGPWPSSPSARPALRSGLRLGCALLRCGRRARPRGSRFTPHRRERRRQARSARSSERSVACRGEIKRSRPGAAKRRGAGERRLGGARQAAGRRAIRSGEPPTRARCAPRSPQPGGDFRQDTGIIAPSPAPGRSL